MYHPAVAEQKRVFWAFVRIAFIVSAVILWVNEHEKVNQLLSASNAKQSPIVVNVPPISVPPAQVIVTPRAESKPGKNPRLVRPTTTKKPPLSVPFCLS